MRKALFVLVALIMICGIAFPALPATADVYNFSIQLLTLDGAPPLNPPAYFNPITIAGDCGSTNYVGQLNQYFVHIDWGDGLIDDGIVPNIAQSGQGFSGTWCSASHSYSSGGNYTINVILYHQQYPGAECSTEATCCVVIPVVVAGSNSPICQGGTLQLTGGPDCMSSYHWTGPNGFTSNAQNPSIPNATQAMAGTYTLTATYPNGGQGNATTNVIVSLPPSSTITTPSSVCAGSTGHTASVPDAGPNASYSWSVTGQGTLTGVGNQSSIAWNALSAGKATISVTVTNKYGCMSANSTNVTVNAELIATASSNSPAYEDATISLFGGPAE